MKIEFSSEMFCKFEEWMKDLQWKRTRSTVGNWEKERNFPHKFFTWDCWEEITSWEISVRKQSKFQESETPGNMIKQNKKLRIIWTSVKMSKISLFVYIIYKIL